MLSLLYLVVKAQQYFVTSSCIFLDEKTVLEIWLNPGLNLTMFRGTGPWSIGSGPGWESKPTATSLSAARLLSSLSLLPQSQAHPNTYTFLPNGIKNKKVYTCFYSERSAFADRFPSLTSSHGTLRPL